VDLMAEANRFWGTTELALSTNKAERIAAIEAMIERAKTAHRIVKERVDAGLSNTSELAIAGGDFEYAKALLLDEGDKPDKKIMDLMQKRLESAKTTWNARAVKLFLGTGVKVTGFELIQASERLTRAQQDMTDIAADHLRILESRFDRMTKVRKRLEQ